MKKILYILAYSFLATMIVGCVKDEIYVDTTPPPSGDSPVVINEIYSQGGRSSYGDFDWVEFYNNSNAPVDISGYKLYDSGGESGGKVKKSIPSGTVIAAYGFYLIQTENLNTPHETDFGLSSGGETIWFEDNTGVLLESVEFPDLAIEQSYARNPDGTGAFEKLTPTPGASNNGAVPLPSISNLSRTPQVPTNEDNVVISAKVVAGGSTTLTSVVLKWTLNTTAQTNITMTNNSGTYSATIVKQAVGAEVAYTVSATNSEGGTANESGNYIVLDATAPPADYTKLKLNEISGVGTDDDKFYELINTGTEDINLAGCQIFYNANGSVGGDIPMGDGNLTWTGAADQIIEAGKLYTLLGRNKPGSFTTGLTAGRNIRIIFKDPDGNVIDQFIRAEDTGDYEITDKSYSRISDGTGPFYFTTPTPNVTNGTSTAGLKLVPDTKTPVVDYTKLKLNEISGVGTDDDKFYELINTGTADINLEGCQLFYNANGAVGGDIPVGDGSLTWTGAANQTAEAGKLFSLIGRNVTGSFTTGLTAGRNIRITFKDPEGNIIDEFVRAEDTDDYAITDKSYSRIPDGTGPFYFTTPTPNTTNGTSTAGLKLVPSSKIDYTQLVINEIDGNGKFVEIYNKGSVAISLTDVTLVKNESGTWWTGGAVSIAAGGYYTISQSGQSDPGASETTGASGISPKQNLKFQLKAPNATEIDVFLRTNGGALGGGVTPDYGSGTPYSFSRCPDGTGAFGLALPSCNAANPATEVGPIVTNP